MFHSIKDLREDNDYTQQQVADYLHLNRNVYWRYETSQREIPVWAAIKLAQFYHVTLDYLLGVSDYKESKH